MIKYLLMLAISVSILSCGSQQGDTKDTPALPGHDTAGDIDYMEKQGDSMLIPAFEIAIKLSNKASEKLITDKETIVVAAWFAGQPKDTTTQEFAESGEMHLGSAEQELTVGNTAKFQNLKFSKAQYDSLADKDIRVLINVYSGRHSTQYNLLDCDILSDKMSAVQGKKFVLAAKLIGETDGLQVKP